MQRSSRGLQGPFIKRDVPDSGFALVRYDNCTINVIFFLFRYPEAATNPNKVDILGVGLCGN